MVQAVILCTVFIVVVSSFRVHSCLSSIPHIPTSVVLHNDEQNVYGFFGSRPSSCVMNFFSNSFRLFQLLQIFNLFSNLVDSKMASYVFIFHFHIIFV